MIGREDGRGALSRMIMRLASHGGATYAWATAVFMNFFSLLVGGGVTLGYTTKSKNHYVVQYEKKA